MQCACTIIRLWPVRLYNMFPHYLTKGMIFGGKNNLFKLNMYFDFLYNFCVIHFSFYEELNEIWSKLYIGFHESTCHTIVMKLVFSGQIFEKYPNIKFRENRLIGSRIFPCRQMDGQTDMTKLIIVFRNFSIPPDKLIGSYNGMKSVYCAVRTWSSNKTV